MRTLPSADDQTKAGPDGTGLPGHQWRLAEVTPEGPLGSQGSVCMLLINPPSTPGCQSSCPTDSFCKPCSPRERPLPLARDPGAAAFCSLWGEPAATSGESVDGAQMEETALDPLLTSKEPRGPQRGGCPGSAARRQPSQPRPDTRSAL